MSPAARHTATVGHTRARIAKRVPNAVFCLFTALRFHGRRTHSTAVVRFARVCRVSRVMQPYLDAIG